MRPLSLVTPNVSGAEAGFSAEADFLRLIATGDVLFATEAVCATGAVLFATEAVCATVKLVTTDVTDGVGVFDMMNGLSGCAALNSASMSTGCVFEMMRSHHRKGVARKRITTDAIKSGGT